MQQIRLFKSCQAKARFALGFLIPYAGLSIALTCSAQEAPQAAEPVTRRTCPYQPPAHVRPEWRIGCAFPGQGLCERFLKRGRREGFGWIDSAFSSFFGSVSNTSLGMPETEISPNLSSRDGLLSKAYFREYLIPADQPSSMRLGYRDVSIFDLPAPRDTTMTLWQTRVSRSCDGAISFVPGAGKDYEVAFTWQGTTCRASVSEVVRKDDAVELMPVPVSAAPDC